MIPSTIPVSADDMAATANPAPEVHASVVNDESPFDSVRCLKAKSRNAFKQLNVSYTFCVSHYLETASHMALDHTAPQSLF